MVRRNLMLFSIVCLMAVAIGLLMGPIIGDIPGFLVIAINKTTIEMRLWLAVSLLILFIFGLFIVIQLFRSFFGTVRGVSHWHRIYRGKKARKKTIDGMIAYAEGNWKQAEKLNMAATKQQSETKLLNYLVAAQAAQQQKDTKKRDSYLGLAEHSQDNARIAVYLTQAQLQIQDEQYEQALATLSQLNNDTSSKHQLVLKLLTEINIKLNDWQAVLELLPNLKKVKVFPEKELLEFEEKAYIGKMNSIDKEKGIEALQTIWQQLPSHLQKSVSMVAYYVKQLLEHKAGDEAEILLREQIKKQWHEELVHLYGNAVGRNPSKQLSTAEAWLKHHNNDATLLLTLGKLCLVNELWGKAQSYFEQCLSIKATPEAYIFLGVAQEHLENHQQAFECYKKGLFNVIGKDIHQSTK
ncbi:MAG: heme biosynthesis HemY N-terminal domain-containing protein, partial [Pseudomonadota bacterium]